VGIRHEHEFNAKAPRRKVKAQEVLSADYADEILLPPSAAKPRSENLNLRNLR
jgi:hypothetical protein